MAVGTEPGGAAGACGVKKKGFFETKRKEKKRKRKTKREKEREEKTETTASCSTLHVTMFIIGIRFLVVVAVGPRALSVVRRGSKREGERERKKQTEKKEHNSVTRKQPSSEK